MRGPLGAVLAISGRELLEGLRDPSVFFSTVIMPTLFGPLMLWGSLQVMMLVEGDLEQDPPTAVLLLARGGEVAEAPTAEEAAALAELREALLRAGQAAPAPAPSPPVAEAPAAAEPTPVENNGWGDVDDGWEHHGVVRPVLDDTGLDLDPPTANAAEGATSEPEPASGSPDAFELIPLDEARRRAAEEGRAALPEAPLLAIDALLTAGIIDLGVIVEVDDPKWSVELRSVMTWSRSSFAEERAAKALDRLDRRRRAGLLRSWGIDPHSLRALRRSAVSTAAPSTVLGHLLGLILPMVVMLNIIGGATAPCVEAIAGERERGTLETTLVSGAPRGAVLVGKALTILLWTVLTAAGSVFGLTISVLHALATIGGRLGGELDLAPDQLALGGLVLLSVLPVAPLLNLVVTLPTRTTRQAQTVAGFLVMPLMGLCFLSLDESRTLEGISALVPFLNTILAGRAALSGELLPLEALTATGINLALTLGLGAVCAWGFRGERLVLGLATRWPRPFARRDRSSP